MNGTPDATDVLHVVGKCIWCGKAGETQVDGSQDTDKMIKDGWTTNTRGIWMCGGCNGKTRVTVADRFKFYGLVAGMVTALAGAYGAYRKAKDETIARDSYKVTTALVARLSDDSLKNHEDVLALREYMDQHIAGTTQPGSQYVPSVASAAPPAPGVWTMAPPAAVVPPPPMVKARPASVKVTKGHGVSSAPPNTLVTYDKDGVKSTIDVPEEWPQ